MPKHSIPNDQGANTESEATRIAAAAAATGLVVVSPNSVRSTVAGPDPWPVSTASFQYTPAQWYVPTQLIRGPHRALLVYHGMGTGKTCVGLRTIEQYITVNPTLHKAIVLCPSNAIIQGWKEQIMRDPGCVVHQALFQQHVHLQTVQSFVKTTVHELNTRSHQWNVALRQYYDHTLFVVDEIHLGVLSANKGTHKKMSPANYLLYLANICPNIRLIALTATPTYNDVRMAYDLIDFLRVFDRKTPQFTLPGKVGLQFPSESATSRHLAILGRTPKKLAAAARGYVSYVRGQDPYTFPVRLAPAPNRTYPYIRKHAFRKQWTSDVLKISLTDTQIKRLKQLRPHSMRHVNWHQWQSIMTAYSSIPYTDWKYTHISRYSPVFATILQSIMSSVSRTEALRVPCVASTPAVDATQPSESEASGIVFVTFQYVRSARLFCHALNLCGFRQRKHTKPAVRHTPYRSYITNISQLPLPSETNDTHTPSNWGSHIGIPPNLMELVNQSKNKSGYYVRIIVVTSAFHTGVSFHNVRQLHIVESKWNIDGVEQAIGRAFRRYSHHALPPDQRNVVVFQYETISKDKTVERDGSRYFDIQYKKMMSAQAVLDALRRSAFDCVLQLSRTNANYANAVQRAYPHVVDVFGVKREPHTLDVASRTPSSAPSVSSAPVVRCNRASPFVLPHTLRPNTIQYAMDVMVGVFRMYKQLTVAQLFAFTRILATTSSSMNHVAVKHYGDVPLTLALKQLMAHVPVINSDGRLCRVIVCTDGPLTIHAVLTCLPMYYSTQRMNTTMNIRDWIPYTPDTINAVVRFDNMMRTHVLLFDRLVDSKFTTTAFPAVYPHVVDAVFIKFTHVTPLPTVIELLDWAVSSESNNKRWRSRIATTNFVRYIQQRGLPSTTESHSAFTVLEYVRSTKDMRMTEFQHYSAQWIKRPLRPCMFTSSTVGVLYDYKSKLQIGLNVKPTRVFIQTASILKTMKRSITGRKRTGIMGTYSHAQVIQSYTQIRNKYIRKKDNSNFEFAFEVFARSGQFHPQYVYHDNAPWLLSDTTIIVPDILKKTPCGNVTATHLGSVV